MLLLIVIACCKATINTKPPLGATTTNMSCEEGREEEKYMYERAMHDDSEMQAASVDAEAWDDYKASGRDDFAIFVGQWYSGELHDDDGVYIGLPPSPTPLPVEEV